MKVLVNKYIAETVSAKISPLYEKKAVLLEILAASLFIGLCAQIRIPLFFTPVPLTGQNFAVMLVGALLGSKKGALATLFYLLEGSLGLPVWAGGEAGFLHLTGFTGGYRLAYPLQAFLAGLIFEKKLGAIKTFICLALTGSLQLGLGTLWLSLFVGIKNMLSLGFYPFLPGEIIKALFVVLFMKSRQKEK
jgi:biotin transport system substrate-specific component